jgi:DNA polymerase-3 subunit alpha
MAAVLSADMDHTDKIVTLIDECANIDLEILPPHVNESVYAFTVAGPRTVRYGLGAIKGVGRGAVEQVVAEREAGGPFVSLEDLCRRLDLARLNRRMIEALVRSGSLDGLGANRATMMGRVEAAMQAGEQRTRALAVGQSDLFGLAGEAVHAGPVAQSIPEQPDFSEAVRLAGERETLGLYLTGHPIDRFLPDLAQFASSRIGDLVSDRPVAGLEPGRAFRGARSATVVGLVAEVRKRGPRVSLLLDDRSGRIEVTLFDEVYQQFRELATKDALLVVEGTLRFDEFVDAWRLAARRLVDLHRAREQAARRLVLRWRTGDARADAAFPGRLARWLTPFRGGQCAVSIEYTGATARGALHFGEDWLVRPTRELMEQLETALGRDGARLLYGSLPGVGSSMAG